MGNKGRAGSCVVRRDPASVMLAALAALSGAAAAPNRALLPVRAVGATDTPHREGSVPHVLVLVLSCFAHQLKWPRLVEWSQRQRGAPQVYILAGNESIPKRKLFELKGLSNSTGTLHVRADDSYSGLTTKMLAALHAVRRAPELAVFTHVLKLDDTDILEGRREGLHFDELEGMLLGNQDDYVGLTNELYRRSMRFRDFPRISDADVASWLARVHPGQISSVETTCDTQYQFVEGGRGVPTYSRHAIDLIAEVFPEKDLAAVARSEQPAEDFVLAKALSHRCVQPKPLSYPGTSHWDPGGSKQVFLHETNGRFPQVNSSICTWICPGNRCLWHCPQGDEIAKLPTRCATRCLPNTDGWCCPQGTGPNLQKSVGQSVS